MKFNAASIAYSWIIAVCFLGLISVWAQPPAADTPKPSLIELPSQILSAAHSDLEYLKASAWCALESDQVAVLKTSREEKHFRGSMAIAPHWRGEPLQQTEQERLNNCVALRLEQTGKNRNLPGSERAALAFLFSDL